MRTLDGTLIFWGYEQLLAKNLNGINSQTIKSDITNLIKVSVGVQKI